MSTSEERMRVLQMLQEGKLDAEAAAQLLQAMETERARPVPPVVPPVPPQAPLPPVDFAPDMRSGSKPRWLRVRVTDTDTGKARVNVRLPLSLVSMGVKLGARYSPEIEGIDVESLLAAAQTEGAGPFVDVYDDEDGEHVEVFLE